jgi:hypothetical protein
MNLFLKDNVDLNVLKKYGFVENEEGDYYHKQISEWGKGKWFMVLKASRDFFCDWYALGSGTDYNNNCSLCEIALKTLLDLFQDELIYRGE